MFPSRATLRNQWLWFALLAAGWTVRLAYAACFSGRVWIDELWVVQEPAFRLLTGQGFLNPMDWAQRIRSWLPAFLIVIPLKLGGPVLVRVLIMAANTVAVLRLTAAAGLRLHVRGAPWLALACGLFTPELLHFGSSCDLSVLAFPFLVEGLVRWHHAPRLAALWLAAAVLVRNQYVMVPAALFIHSLAIRRREGVKALAGAAFLAFAVDASLNSLLYGFEVYPFLNYARVNLSGQANQFGTTPFYQGFEILWRFMTEPLFAAFALLGLPLLWKREPTWFWAWIALAALHFAAPHKEYRFFYGPALLAAVWGGAALQVWLQNLPKKRQWLQIVAVVLVVAVGGWRATKKVAWAQFEGPLRMTASAGRQQSVRGLIVYGWGGIQNGGHYTFQQALPYEYAESLVALRERKLDPALYSHLVLPTNIISPCADWIESYSGAALYRCTTEELRGLLWQK
jgi:hypothetical protein